jgi:hypothetical protein
MFLTARIVSAGSETGSGWSCTAADMEAPLILSPLRERVAGGPNRVHG